MPDFSRSSKERSGFFPPDLFAAIYVVLAVVKTLPRIYVSDYIQRSYERSETRSLYPDAEERGRPSDPE